MYTKHEGLPAWVYMASAGGAVLVLLCSCLLYQTLCRPVDKQEKQDAADPFALSRQKTPLTL